MDGVERDGKSDRTSQSGQGGQRTRGLIYAGKLNIPAV